MTSKFLESGSDVEALEVKEFYELILAATGS